MLSEQNGIWRRGYVYVYGGRVPCVLMTMLLALLPLQRTLASDFLGEKYPLYIVPERDVTLKFGEPFEASCFLNRSHNSTINRNASNLEFTSNRHTYLNHSILNETGIILYVPKLELGETLFHCKLDYGDEMPIIRPISVSVGELPKPVENFTCFSPNWEKLVCNWTTPHNYIKTEYKGILILQGRAARNIIICKEEEVKNSSCTFSGDSYHKAHKEFTFLLNGSNILGNHLQNFTISNHDIVIPASPINLEVVNRTSHSCLIRWTIPHQVHLLPVGLAYKIQVKSPWDDNDMWETLNTPSKIGPVVENYAYNITDLKYAGVSYDIRVYLKSPNSQRTSEPAVKICTTHSTIPSAPPDTTPGCYQRIYNPDPIIYVFWRALNHSLRNGENFSYKIYCIRNNNENCTDHMVEKSNTYAKFNMAQTGTYNFRIYSLNSVGLSENFSTVYVPLLENVPPPLRPAKMTFGEGAYGITWSHGSKHVPLEYTVFYCEDEKEKPLPCKGLINWIKVPGHLTATNVTVTNREKFHHFGVSADYANGQSSGITWATCVVSPGAEITITELATHLVQSRSAQITWQLGCAERSFSGGFILYYCSVGFSEDSNTCEGKEEQLKISDSRARNTTIVNLNPYTTYVVAMAALNEAGIIGRNNSRRFTTLEAAPDPPTNLSSNNVTHSSVNLTWSLPQNKNGPILRFYLYTSTNTSDASESRTLIEVKDKNNIDVSYEKTGLQSLTSYEFTLEACTSAGASPKSKPYHVTTKIHRPDVIQAPNVANLNRSTVNVSWEAPNFLSPYHRYQIQLSNQITNESLNYTNGGLVSIDKFCKSFVNVQFRVRAINIDDEKNEFASDWSKPTFYRCDPANSEFIFVLLCIVILSLLVTSGLCASFLVKQGYVHCKEMEEVVIKLPSGLEPPQDLEKNSREIWPPTYRNSEHEITKITNNNGSDEESLLNDKEEENFKKLTQFVGTSSECMALDSVVEIWDGSDDMKDCEQIKKDLERNQVAGSSPAPGSLPGYSRIGRTGGTSNCTDGYVTLSENGKIVQPAGKKPNPSNVTPPSPQLITITQPQPHLSLSSTSFAYTRSCLGESPSFQRDSGKFSESSFISTINDDYASELDDLDVSDKADNKICNIAYNTASTNYVPHQAVRS